MEANATTERLFFALWPAPGLQQRFHSIVESVLPPKGARRRARIENLHLTLAFIGPVSADVRACLERRADAIQVSPFELVFDRVGCFRRRGLLWLGPTQILSPLLELVQALRDGQSACGLAPESRDYKAHITLARELRRCPPDTAIEPIVWPVHEFVLVRSNLSADGARYDVLRTWALG